MDSKITALPNLELRALGEARVPEALPFIAETVGETSASVRRRIPVAGALLAVTFVWAYWSTLQQLISTWNNQPDYSHGFLVPLLSVFILWTARDRFPGFATQIAWSGLVLVVLSIALRGVAGYYYLLPLDGWTIPLWIMGCVWMIGGWPLARWSLVATLFLYFMIPLPFRAERWLSLPLQGAATYLSTWTLQCLGQPAIAEGHTIHLGTHQLEVEQACSGLRMLIGITGLAVAYTQIVRKAWWEQALLLLAVVPVALAANTARITATALLYQFVSGEAAQKFGHDFAGWAMILLAVGLFAAVGWFLGRLFPAYEIVEVRDLLRGQRSGQV